MKTYVPDGERLREGRKWHLVDADGQVLGRLASRIARILMGKHKSQYTPFLDSGDFVIVVNAEKVRLTGNKGKGKVYRRHTGYPGGLKEIRAEDYLRKRPDRMVEEAVVGMLPKTKLGRAMFRKLKVYKGSQHPHVAQRPETLVL